MAKRIVESVSQKALFIIKRLLIEAVDKTHFYILYFYCTLFVAFLKNGFLPRHKETIMPDRQIMPGNSILLTQNVKPCMQT